VVEAGREEASLHDVFLHYTEGSVA